MASCILFLWMRNFPLYFLRIDRLLIGEMMMQENGESIFNYFENREERDRRCKHAPYWTGFFQYTLRPAFCRFEKKKKKGRAFVVTNSKRRKVKPSRWPRCHSDRCNLISRVGFETKQRSRTVWRYEISPLLWTKQAVWFFSFFFLSLSFSSPVKQVKACVEAPLNALTM